MPNIPVIFNERRVTRYKITFSKTSFGLRIMSPGVGSNFFVERLTRPLSRSWLSIMTYTTELI